jgi:hypothetical protein
VTEHVHPVSATILVSDCNSDDCSVNWVPKCWVVPPDVWGCHGYGSYKRPRKFPSELTGVRLTLTTSPILSLGLRICCSNQAESGIREHVIGW